MGSARKSLVVYDWKMASSLWSCYLNYKNSRITGVVVQVMDSPHLSMPARSQAVLSPWSVVSQPQFLQRYPLKPLLSHQRATRRRLTLILEPGSHTRITELFIYCSDCSLHPYTCALSSPWLWHFRPGFRDAKHFSKI